MPKDENECPSRREADKHIKEMREDIGEIKDTLLGTLGDGKSGLIGKVKALEDKIKLQWGVLLLIAAGFLIKSFF